MEVVDDRASCHGVQLPQKPNVRVECGGTNSFNLAARGLMRNTLAPLRVPNNVLSGASFQLLSAFRSQAVVFSLKGVKKNIKCRLRVDMTRLGKLSQLRDESTRHFAK